MNQPYASMSCPETLLVNIIVFVGSECVLGVEIPLRPVFIAAILQRVALRRRFFLLGVISTGKFVFSRQMLRRPIMHVGGGTGVVWFRAARRLC